MNERERQEWQDGEAVRVAARAKFSDGTQQLEVEDLKHFDDGEVKALINAGRLVHAGIGPDRRLRRR